MGVFRYGFLLMLVMAIAACAAETAVAPDALAQSTAPAPTATEQGTGAPPAGTAAVAATQTLSAQDTIGRALERTLSVPHSMRMEEVYTSLPTEKLMGQVEFKGEFDGADTHVFEQARTDKRDGDILEIVTSDGKYYVNGPAPDLGIQQTGWVVLSEVPPQDPLEYRLGFVRFFVQYLEGAVRVSEEMLDGVTCDVYTRDRDVTMGTWIAWHYGSVSEETLELIEEADTRYWVCEDGYLRQMVVTIVTHDKNILSQKVKRTYRVRYGDLNSDIVIAAPTQATPLISSRHAAATAEAVALRDFEAEAYGMLAEARNWKLLYSDDFETGKGKLPMGQEKYQVTLESVAVMTRTLTGGKYRWEASASPFGSNQLPANLRDVTVADFYVSVDLRRVQGRDISVGVVVRAKDMGHYLFLIDEDYRSYALEFHGPGTSSSDPSATYMLLAGTGAQAIRVNEMNRLTVIGKGPRFILFINDEYVGYADSELNPEGQIGVEMHPIRENVVVVEFDNLEVRVPPDAPPAVP